MGRNILLTVVSIVFAFVVLEGVLRLGGALFLWQQEQSHQKVTFKNGEYRIVCIGESTTALGGEYSYPAQLQNRLNKIQNKYHFVVINKGIPSISTDVILENLPGYIDAYHPQMIVAMMGINDHAFYAPDAWNRFKTIKLMRMIYAHLMDKWKKPAPKFQKIGEKSLQNPPEVNNPILLARHFEDDGEYPQAIAVLDKSLMQTTQKDFVARVLILWELAQCYQSSGDLPKAVEYYHAVLSLVPTHNRAWGDLGETYMLMGEQNKAEVCLLKQITIDPHEAWYFSQLASCFQQLGDKKDVEPMLLYGLRMNPDNGDILKELGYFYLQEGRWSQAAELLQRVLAHSSGGDMTLAMSLKEAYQKMGAQDKAQEILKTYKSDMNSQTQKNYEKLKQLAFSNGISLVVMQYPMRDIKPLKDMVGVSPKIIFVDNEDTFKRAVADGGYSTYFIDRFGGDFGHASPKGNALIAANLAKAVLESLGN